MAWQSYHMKEIKETNHHICAYCGNEYVSDKPFSHVIPKQFFRRFKRGICNKDAYSTYFKRLTQREPKGLKIMDEKIMTVFASRAKGRIVVVTNKKHTFKLDNVVELIGYNSDYVSVVQSPFVNKIKIFDIKGCEVDALDRSSSIYF